MNWLVYHIASGQAFFTGVALILFSVGISYWKGAIGPRLSGAALLFGIAAIVFSSSSIGYGYYGLMVAALVAWLGSSLWPKAKHYAAATLCVLLVGAVALAVPYHRLPRAERTSARRLAVIGDSVTAGVGDKSVTWPKLLSAEHGVEVQDISHVGDTAGSALKRLQKEPIDAPVVLVQIGGNDVLGTTSAGQFASDLDALLGAVQAKDRQVFMFELPLPPLYHEFNRAQRTLARKHGVRLIPKRVFLDVIAPKEATLDTIHLSAAGHEQMAASVWRVVGPAYEE